MTLHALIYEVLEGLLIDHEGAVPAHIARAALEERGCVVDPFGPAVESAGFALIDGYVISTLGDSP
jgi:sulfur relay (sulfurtransferase) complex TusBCD TusD component (DsrE family)